MYENIGQDRHYTGTFTILNENITGELIYNKQNGVILLNLIKEIDSKSFWGKSYGNLPIIVGKLNSGAIVTLGNNRCTNNHTQAFSSQQLTFISEYMIWSNSERVNATYNKMVCILKNAYQWSGFSAFEETETSIKVKDTVEGIILNAGGYTHTSIALRDAVACCDVPVVEVHISNIAEREDFRRVSLLTDVCAHSIIGQGTDGYLQAVEWIINKPS